MLWHEMENTLSLMNMLVHCYELWDVITCFPYKESYRASFADVIKKALQTLLGHLHIFLNKSDPLMVTSDFRWENQQKRK